MSTLGPEQGQLNREEINSLPSAPSQRCLHWHYRTGRQCLLAQASASKRLTAFASSQFETFRFTSDSRHPIARD